MKLSTRLQKLLDVLTENSIIADIGSDHAYLCVAYILKKFGKKAYACDINENALNQAKKTLLKYPTSKVELQLMNGIEHLKNDVQEIVIAGMGFETIQLILKPHLNKLKNLNKIIIQCNKNLDKLKLFLNESNIYINEVHLINENGIFYEILVCSVHNTQLQRPIEYDDLYEMYLDYQLNKIKQIQHYNIIPNLKQKYEEIKQKKFKVKNKAKTSNNIKEIN